MKILLTFLSSVLLCGCLGMPTTVTPVENFEVDSFLGKWYEIARLDHRFERGLSEVTAEYSLKSDGGLNVLNRGFSADDNEWKEAEGKAYFIDSDTEGYLKVSFFGPFYGSYVVFELEEEYQYAFISGSDTNYLWFLSRTPTVAPEVIENFEAIATERGFNVDDIIYVEQ